MRNLFGSHSANLQFGLATTRTSTALVPIDILIPRLDALLMVLKTCSGSTCNYPWSVLHPSGNVQSLRDALGLEYDEFYASQDNVEFRRCEKGYILDSEGPTGVKTFVDVEDVGAMVDEVWMGSRSTARKTKL